MDGARLCGCLLAVVFVWHYSRHFLQLARGCLEDRPSNFGSPQRVVLGFGGADEVVLANRPVDRKRMPGHVGGEDTVSSVDVSVGTGVDDRREFCWWDHGGAD